MLYRSGEAYGSELSTVDPVIVTDAGLSGFRLSFVFGFTVYESFESNTVARTGHAPMPSTRERVLGGHAVCAIGYDESKRWFICRNSWGTSWGMRGYFTLPYDYLTSSDLAADFWTIRVVS